jgi:TIR domain
MAVLFISHSSKDDAAASDLETWLRRNDFTNIFIDHNDISGGEKWAQALRESAGACRVIMCLVTNQWLASDECFGEFKAAWYMGKRIIPLLAADPIDAPSRERLAKVLGEDQGLNVAACMDENGGLDLARDPNVERRLKEGLRAAGTLAKVGPDPEAFAVDRDLRPTPFPGLASIGDDDADARRNVETQQSVSKKASKAFGRR